MVNINKPDGTVLQLLVDDDSQRVAELMGDDILNLRFSMPTSVTIPLRSWCVFGNKKYYLFTSPQVTKHNDRNYEYVMPMYSVDYMLKITLMRNRTYNASADEWGGDLRLKFPLTGTPREHLEMIAACLNEAETEPDTVWAVDYENVVGMVKDENGAHENYDGSLWNDEGKEQLVNYEFNYCIDAIRNVATAFDTEYEFYDRTITGTVYHLLALHNIEYNKETPLDMSYGEDNGFVSGIARRNENELPPIDRLYIQGGEQNIPYNYGRTPKGYDGEHKMQYDGDNSSTLLLPRYLTDLSSGIPTGDSEYKGVACFYIGNRFYFSLDPTVDYDENGNPYIEEKNYHDVQTGDPIYETLYDSDGEYMGSELLPVPTPTFLVSDDGRSVERVRHTYYDPDFEPKGTKVESFYDASEVYPMRIGGVSQVVIETATRTIDDGQGGTTTDTYKLYDIIDALPDCPAYDKCTNDKEVMTVIFQDGMLAGREFELETKDGYPICEDVIVYKDNVPIPAKKMNLCPSEQDGVTMPNDAFAPKAGDHYIAFHCSMPQEYVGTYVDANNGVFSGADGIANGAEYRALKEMVSYLYEHGKETYTFSGAVDVVWANRVWNLNNDAYSGAPYYRNIPYSTYFALGQHIHATDVQLFGVSGLVMRVTGIKQRVNNAKNIELTLTNTQVLKYNWTKELAKTVEEVRVRPRFRRPDNPFFPRHKGANEVLELEEVVDANGNVLDIRRNVVVPLTEYKATVGLNDNEGLRKRVGDKLDSSAIEVTATAGSGNIRLGTTNMPLKVIDDNGTKKLVIGNDGLAFDAQGNISVKSGNSYVGLFRAITQANTDWTTMVSNMNTLVSVFNGHSIDVCDPPTAPNPVCWQSGKITLQTIGNSAQSGGDGEGSVVNNN